MNGSSWLKQTKDKALFEDLLWSRPENKMHAGKLLIVGGNSQGFIAPATTYNLAIQAGIGSLRVIMPESLRSSVAKYIDEPLFVPANQSGSFGSEALAELLDHSAWSDLTLLAGDFGKNSETSILLESFVTDYKGALCLTGDSIDPFLSIPKQLLDREETLIVVDFNKLQKLLLKSGSPAAITSTMDLIQLVDYLNALTLSIKASVITYHQGYLIAASAGQVSTTQSEQSSDWSLKLASYSSVWWLQNKDQTIKALTTAIFEAIN